MLPEIRANQVRQVFLKPISLKILPSKVMVSFAVASYHADMWFFDDRPLKFFKRLMAG